jgi:hypothetical protein
MPTFILADAPLVIEWFGNIDIRKHGEPIRIPWRIS